MNSLPDSTRSIVADHQEQHLSYAKYVFGFVGSVTLTLAAYVLATRGTASKDILIALLSGLAIVQFLVQMFFFLHLGDERRPRWKLMMALLMLGFVLIIVFGSLWVMHNLNYRMTPQQMNQYLKSQDSL